MRKIALTPLHKLVSTSPPSVQSYPSLPPLRSTLKLVYSYIIFSLSMFLWATFPFLLHHPDNSTLLLPSSFFLVPFFPSYPSLWAIGTIFQAALNSTISSSHLASLSPSSSSFMPTAVDTTGVLLTACLFVYLSVSAWHRHSDGLLGCLFLPAWQEQRPSA